MTTDQFKNLSTDQVNALTSSQVKANASSAQGASLTDDAAADPAPAPAADPAADPAAAPAQGDDVAVDGNEVEPVVEPASDEDPTANDMKLVDVIVEYIMGVADAANDGMLSKDEFVGANFFKNVTLSDEQAAKVKARREKWFDAAKGDDDLMSPDELAALMKT